MSETQGNTLWLDGGKYYSELARNHKNKLLQMGMELADGGLLTAPGYSNETIDFFKDGVVEIYMGGGEGSLVILTKNGKGEYTQYSYRNDGNKWSSSNGIASEDRIATLKIYGIGPNSSATKFAKAKPALLEGLKLQVVSVEDAEKPTAESLSAEWESIKKKKMESPFFTNGFLLDEEGLFSAQLDRDIAKFISGIEKFLARGGKIFTTAKGSEEKIPVTGAANAVGGIVFYSGTTVIGTSTSGDMTTSKTVPTQIPHGSDIIFEDPKVE